MENKTMIQLKINELDKRLMNYQKASVDAVVTKFGEQSRVVLADEVGLGKTEIAKGVIAKLAKIHWETEDRPLRVAYICSNQNVAKQNFPKLMIFPSGITENKKLAKELQEALTTYQTTTYRGKISGFLRESSVYTRVCEWLIGVYGGNRFEDVVSDEIKGIYLGVEEQGITPQTESGINQGKSDYQKAAAEKLLEDMEKILNTYGQSILGVVPSTSEPLQKWFYGWNQLIAARLSNRISRDYRLSMQHLYTAENERYASGDVMQLECLTPSTSLKIGQGEGTIEERTLLKATVEYCGGVWHGKEKINLEDVLAFQARLCACKYKINQKFQKIDGKQTIPEIRRIFIDENIKSLSYDLVIMDEFQNFSELLSDQTEYGKLANALFNKKNTKMLLLSATPIKSTSRWKDVKEDTTVAESSLRAIKRFLGNEKEDDLYQLGIYRTERNQASKHKPVLEYVKNSEFDFTDVLLSQQLSSKIQMDHFLPSYVIATPYAMSFTDSYQLWKDNAVQLVDECNRIIDLEQFQSLFIGGQTTNTGYQALEADLFASEPQNLLWIPPANPSQKLEGVFAGKEGFSKTLIFANYNMTPKAFTYLFCEKANDGVGTKVEEIKITLPDTIVVGKETRLALEDGFSALFGSPIGQRCVLANRKGEISFASYEVAVQQYCMDGCFEDMVKEYVTLLENEYNNNDLAMSYAVRKAFGYQPDTIQATKYDAQKKSIANVEHRLANRFAVGLYTNSIKKASPDGILAKIKPAFNSPVWPFVFTTTSIGTEGIDLHWYARNVVHWALPRRAIDLEQRTGRVLRYQCHTVRLNKSLEECSVDGSIKGGWEDSGLYQTQLNFFSDEEKTPQNNGCYHVRSYSYYNQFGSDYENQKVALEFIKEYHEILKELSPYGKHQQM